MSRLIPLAALVGMCAAVAVGGPARAHGGDTAQPTDYRTTVTAGPGLPGVAVRAVEAGARLELVNRSGRPVEVLGYAGEPYLEVRPDGVYENTHSPAAYLNTSLVGGAVPATADPTLPPRWRRIADGSTARWHDQRTHWSHPTPPAQVVRDPAGTHRLRDWVVPLRQGVAVHEVRGTLDWVPPPSPGGWWVATLVTAGLGTLVARRPGRVAVAALTAAAGLGTLGYAGARLLDAGGFARVTGQPPWPLLIGALAVVAGVLTLRRRSDVAILAAGATLALFVGLLNAVAFHRSVLPAAGPAWGARVAVLLALGVGAGLVAGTVLRLRELAAPARPRREWRIGTGAAGPDRG